MFTRVVNMFSARVVFYYILDITCMCIYVGGLLSEGSSFTQGLFFILPNLYILYNKS